MTDISYQVQPVDQVDPNAPFEPEEKQALLEAPARTNRRETLVTLMEFALRAGDDDVPLQ